MEKKIILDCDPGQDDAINLLLAMSSPRELEILGITTVAGNVPLELTQRNARIICNIAHRNDMKIYAGCSKPMIRELVTAEKVHGSTGIDGVEIFEPQLPLRKQHAVDFLIEVLNAADNSSVTLVPTGPLTNIATAINKEPSILEKINQIVIMGGAMREGGNLSPSAEFNILVDPHAADIVFQCGKPLIVMGLDVTHQVIATKKRIDKIASLNNRISEVTVNMLNFFTRHDANKYGFDGAPLHDPCTVAWLLKPELFQGKLCNIKVETRSELTMGHTAVDFWGVTKAIPNSTWMHTVDVDGFYDLLYERLSRYE